MFRTPVCLAIVLVGLAAPLASAEEAPGAPGVRAVWTFAGKTGLGTSYERYVDGRYADGGPTGPVSRVWFSVADGIVTETAHGLIHEAQLKDLQLLVPGADFFDEEKVATTHEVEYLHVDAAGRPLAPAYRLINVDPDGKYRIEKHVFTDPDRQTLFMRVIVTANTAGITPYLLVNPHAANTGRGDTAHVTTDQLAAGEGNAHAVVRATSPFLKTSAGFEGISDGWQDLHADRTMDWAYTSARDGNVALTAQLPPLDNETMTFDVAVGFGASREAATAEAEASLAAGYATVLDRYNGAGATVGWEDYLSGLSELPALAGMAEDGGKLLQASALVLKSLEDKTNAGALIASLSIPWGDVKSADEFQTGYRAVWPRDFYQCAMALLALGDRETPLTAFRYLDRVQVKQSTPGNVGAVGWFLQKTHVDGTLEWTNLQMDQTAMPIMLAWKLRRAGLLTESELDDRYDAMLKPAAEFLANGGSIRIKDPSGGAEQAYDVVPPWTRNERWEEQAGYSPSTVAAVITGLVVAADLAREVGDPGAAAWYERQADLFAANVERTMFTTTGSLGDGRHYLRLTKNGDPNDGAPLDENNGQPGLDERLILDPGFLELVRYGVRPASDPYVLDSMPEIDDLTTEHPLRVGYDLPCEGGPTVPGFRRYGNDGYGERTDTGSAWEDKHPAQRGRVWPFLTGERGHFELERAKAASGGVLTDTALDELRRDYVRGMECFANEGLMLPEQVWDEVGNNGAYGFTAGEGTDSATALAWTHAEYVKLLRSLEDGDTWDAYPVVRARYGSPFTSAFVQVFLRGTHNAWEPLPMRLIGDHQWRALDVRFGTAPDERLKLDLYGDWVENFGDNDRDGTADRNGADIPVTDGAGLYTVTFDDRTLRYAIAKQ